MGYNLYVTRADAWYDASSHPIPHKDWAAIVSADPDLEWSPSDYVETHSDAGNIREHLVIWLRHPDRVPFWYYQGAIEAKNPDVATIRKLVELARNLRARCFGEEGEEYD